MKTKYALLTLYLLLIGCLIFTCATLAKYTTIKDPEMNFEIGDQLYFKYKRGSLFRNDTLIIGVETSYKDGDEDVQCIETMNVVPGDDIVYHFFISNYDDSGSSVNNVNGEFFAVCNGLLSLPMKEANYDAECIVMYRQIPLDGSEASESFTLLSDTKLKLPKVSEQKVKYEFKISVALDSQIENTTSDDYFDATLRINLYLNAASK